MEDAGISPDLAAFNALIDACASAGDVPRAEGAFGELNAAGLVPDAISYTSLIKACAVAGKPRRAERIYREMQQKSNHFSTFIPPSVHTYRHLMAAHVRNGNGSPFRVLALFDEMTERRLQPTTKHYLLALSACTQIALASARVGQPRAEAAEGATAAGMAAEGATAARVTAAGVTAGVTAGPTAGITAGAAEGFSLVLPLSASRAQRLYASMREDGFRLDTKTLLALDHMCRQYGQTQFAARLRSERSMAIHPMQRGARRRDDSMA